jgi:hypothetical protein
MRERSNTMREANNEAFDCKLKPLTYLPWAPSVPDHLFQKLVDELNEYVDGQELSDKVAVGRLPGTKRWIALFHDGEGLSVFETNGEAPALADVLSAVAALANAPKKQRKSAKGVAQ